MALNRYRTRGNIGADSSGSNITGVIEPPPFPAQDFSYIWKTWLNILSTIVTNEIAQDWHSITAVSTSVDGSSKTITTIDQVILADPDSGALTIVLPDPVEDGLSNYIKNIDESGTYTLTVDPGTNKIDGQPAAAAPATTDITISALNSYHFVYDSVNTTWWII